LPFSAYHEFRASCNIVIPAQYSNEGVKLISARTCYKSDKIQTDWKISETRLKM